MVVSRGFAYGEWEIYCLKDMSFSLEKMQKLLKELADISVN